MLIRKIVLTSLVIIAASFYINSYAADVNCKNYISNPKNLLVTITQPEGNKNIWGKSFVICGITKHKDVKLEALIYNKSKKEFMAFNDKKGNNIWKFSSSGIIIKELQLPSEGIYKVKIISYLKNNKKNMQTNNYLITALKKSFKNDIQNSYLNNADYLWYIN